MLQRAEQRELEVLAKEGAVVNNHVKSKVKLLHKSCPRYFFRQTVSVYFNNAAGQGMEIHNKRFKILERYKRIMANDFSIEKTTEVFKYDEEGKSVLSRKRDYFKNLNPRQHRFVLEMAKGDVTAAEAARRAGFGKKDSTPQVMATIGNREINKEGVREAIALTQKSMIEAAGLDHYEVVNELREIILLAKEDGKYDAAVKAASRLGDFLNMWDHSDGKTKNGNTSSFGGLFLDSIPEKIEDMIEASDSATDVTPKE